jgi:hypothetical protein
LQQQILDWGCGKPRMAGRHTPVYVKEPVGIHRHNPFHAALTVQRNPTMHEINLGFSQIEL